MDSSAFQSAKLWIVEATGLSKDALHVYVGLTVFLVAAWLFRKTPRSWAPLLIVLGMAALGEMLDARDDLRTLGHWRSGASLHDVVNTTAWPSVLWTLFRTGRLTLGRPRDLGQ